MGKVSIYDGSKDTVIEFAINNHKTWTRVYGINKGKQYKRSKFKFYEPKEKSISEKLWGK